MFIIRNYNKFLVGSVESFKWENFYIHRFRSDYAKLVKFDSIEGARAFIDHNPELERDFDAWIVKDNGEFWNHDTKGGPYETQSKPKEDNYERNRKTIY